MKIKLYWLLTFLLFCFLSVGNVSNLCHIYTYFGFDNQALIFWKYTASIGLLPYRDVFYPYGYMTYYLGQNMVFTSLYLLIAPLLFLTVTIFINNIFKNFYLTFASVVAYYIFILTHTGFEIFSRYGILLGLLIVFVFVEYKKLYKNIFVTLGLGIFSGLLFIISNDISLYIIILYILYSSLMFFILEGFKFQIKRLVHIVKRIFIYSSGYIIGIIPFLIYIYQTHSFNGFIYYLQSLSAIAEFAKTPFLHSLPTTDNLFTLSVLMMAIVYNSYNLIYNKKKVTFHTYSSLGLIIVILLLEQKSIIRSIDRQITFIAILLMMVLFADTIDYIKEKSIHTIYIFIYYLCLLVSVVFIIGLKPVDLFVNQLPNYNSMYLLTQNLNNSLCLETNKTNYLSRMNINAVINRIKNTPKFNGKIYSFPSDAVLYSVLKQKPPYYPSLYEATPPIAQEKIIKYLEDNEINIIVFNNKIQSIEDTVPDKIRGKQLLGFINSHFSKYDQIGDYIILKRYKN